MENFRVYISQTRATSTYFMGGHKGRVTFNFSSVEIITKWNKIRNRIKRIIQVQGCVTGTSKNQPNDNLFVCTSMSFVTQIDYSTLYYRKMNRMLIVIGLL